MSKKGIKMKDIANMLGVSTVTVSKALADKDGVSEELKKKIKETARELGYRNRDSMRSGSATNTVGILVADHFVASGHSGLCKRGEGRHYLCPGMAGADVSARP